MGDRPGRGGRQNRVELAHSLRRPWNRVGESYETAILNGRQPVGTMGIELARRAEARASGGAGSLSIMGIGGHMPAKATATWRGDGPAGVGTFTAGDSGRGHFTLKSRLDEEPGSSPEQLIAAAHACCFSLALSEILAQAGRPSHSVSP